MDRIAETSILFDIYGGLLSEKKREVMELYYEENLSLSEIAEEQGVSRAAVHDALRTAEKNLNDYEAKLGLEADYIKRQETVKALRNEIFKLVAIQESESAALIEQASGEKKPASAKHVKKPASAKHIKKSASAKHIEKIEKLLSNLEE